MSAVSRAAPAQMKVRRRPCHSHKEGDYRVPPSGQYKSKYGADICAGQKCNRAEVSHSAHEQGKQWRREPTDEFQCRLIEPPGVALIYFRGQPVEEEQSAGGRNQPEREQQPERWKDLRQKVFEGVADEPSSGRIRLSREEIFTSVLSHSVG